MAIIPTDLLAEAEERVVVAQTLPEIPRREVLCRTAVSRAYYAAFHAALDAARRQGYSRDAPAGMSSHEALWDWWFVDERPNDDLSKEGDALKIRRVQADYRLREHCSTESARESTALARKVIARVKDLF